MKSIFNSHNILLKALLALALCLVSVHAWGSSYYAKLIVSPDSNSRGMGKVYVALQQEEGKPSPNVDDYKDEMDATSPDSQNTTYTFWMMAKPQGGYVFDSWTPYENSDDYNNTYSNQEQDISITTPNSNGTTEVKYNANFKERETPYVINYQSDKTGNVTYPSTDKYKVSDTTSLSIASLVGYDFDYWEANATTEDETDLYEKNWKSSSEYKSNDTFEGKFGNVVLTAHWIVKNYSITYDLDGGSGDFSNTGFTIERSIPIPAKVPTKTGRTFRIWEVDKTNDDNDTATYWTKGEQFSNNSTIPAGRYGSPTLKAIYDADEYTITFDVSDTNEAEKYSQNPSIKYDIDGSTNNGRSATLMGPVVTKDGWDFDYWELDSSEKFGSWSPDTRYDQGIELKDQWETVTLKPHWKPKEYTIILMPVGGLFYGETAVVEKKTVKYNSNADTGSGLIINLPTVSKAGYTFNGWSVVASDNNGHNWDTTADQNASVNGKWGNVTLTAQWTPTNYKVTLKPNGGTLEGKETSEETYNYNIEGTGDDDFISKLPKVERTGYSFAGWKVTSTGESGWSDRTPGVDDNEMSVVGMWGDVTLTAQWEAIPGYIKISVSGLQKNDSAVFEVSYDSVPFVVSLDSSNASGLLVKIPDVRDGKSVTVTPKAWPKNYGGLSTGSVSKTVDFSNDNKNPVLYNFSLGERTSNIFETFREF